MHNFKESIITDIANDFSQFGKEFGFSDPIILNDHEFTDIYIVKKHAIQFEIDWREFDIFLYVVRLIDEQLPPKSVIYQYENGLSCRTYIEEIYQVKNPIYKLESRYTTGFLYRQKEFYIKLIQTDPQKLFSYMCQLL